MTNPSRRLRAVLCATAAALTTTGVVALAHSPAPQPHVTLTMSPAGDAPEPELPVAIDDPTTTTTTTTQPAPTTTTAPRVRNPVVRSTKPIGDLPVGSVLSGPVDLRGVVRNAAGQPVAGACVVIRVLNASSSEPVLDAKTGPDGTFATDYNLSAESDWANVMVRDCTGATNEFVRKEISVMTFAGQTHDIVVTVQSPSTTVRGTLLASDGSPVPHACIYVSMNDIITFGVPTNADGTFEVRGLGLGRFSLAPMTNQNDTCDWTAFALARDELNMRIDGFIKPDKSVSQFAYDDITSLGEVLTYKLRVSPPLPGATQ